MPATSLSYIIFKIITNIFAFLILQPPLAPPHLMRGREKKKEKERRREGKVVVVYLKN
jgi:hypothetical protein